MSSTHFWSDESEADDQESLPVIKQKKNWIIAETFENANQVTEWLKL